VRDDGSISARTEGVFGEECIDKIDVLESLLDALTVDSSFTEDYMRVADRVDVASSNNLEATT
jgi:hypothetical protein